MIQLKWRENGTVRKTKIEIIMRLYFVNRYLQIFLFLSFPCGANCSLNFKTCNEK